MSADRDHIKGNNNRRLVLIKCLDDDIAFTLIQQFVDEDKQPAYVEYEDVEDCAIAVYNCGWVFIFADAIDDIIGLVSYFIEETKLWIALVGSNYSMSDDSNNHVTALLEEYPKLEIRCIYIDPDVTCSRLAFIYGAEVVKGSKRYIELHPDYPIDNLMARYAWEVGDGAMLDAMYTVVSDVLEVERA